MLNGPRRALGLAVVDERRGQQLGEVLDGHGLVGMCVRDMVADKLLTVSSVHAGQYSSQTE